MEAVPPRFPHRVAAVMCLVAALLSACSGSSAPGKRGSAAEQASAQEPGVGADATERDPLRVRYEATKRTFALMRDRGELGADAFHTVLHTRDELHGVAADSASCPEGVDCAFDLVNCNSGSDYVPADAEGQVSDWLEVQLTSTAFDVLRLEHLLREQRYPEAAWRPALARHEREVLEVLRSQPPTADNFTVYADLDTRLQQALLDGLNAYRAQASDTSLLFPVVEAGCGAGEIGIQVATDPRGAAAEFIPVFHYRLCGVRGIDPEDTRACDHWREPAQGLLFDVAGDYRYRVRWPDGHVSRGKLSFTNLEEGQTVTLRRH